MASSKPSTRATEAAHGRGAPQLSHCAEQVRTHHRERYLATVIAPAERRDDLFALYAFDHEITKVRQIVSEPMAGLIRLQWWREVLAEIGSGQRAQAHPVAEGLSEPLAAGRLAPSRLEAALAARERELEDPPPAELNAFEHHLEASGATITLTALEILGVDTEAARQAGRASALALGLADTVRMIPGNARRRRLFLPAELLDRYGVDPEAAFRGEVDAGLRRAVGELAARARGHLETARQRRAAVPRRALPALLPGTLAEIYLARLARAGYDPFAAAPRRSSAMAPLKLLWCWSTGRF